MNTIDDIIGLNNVKKGSDVLVKTDKEYLLIKYLGGSLKLGSGVVGSSSEKSHIDTRRNDTSKSFSLDIETSHLLRFDFNEEYNRFFPSSEKQNIFITFDSVIPEIFIGSEDIKKQLGKIISEGYITNVITPFLESRPTQYEMPSFGRFFRKRKIRNAFERFRNELEKTGYGDVIYLGSNEEVWLLTRCPPEQSSIYTDSYNSPLFFSNSLLNGENFGFVQKGMPVCERAMLGGKLFVFPAVGEGENCYAHKIRGRPSIITTDPAKMVEHFKTTPFNEFKDVLIKYISRKNQ